MLPIDAITPGALTGQDLTASPKQDVGEQAEKLFAKMLVTEVRKTMPESFLGDGPAEMFADLFDQALADSLAEGGSLGIAAHFEAHSGNEK